MSNKLLQEAQARLALAKAKHLEAQTEILRGSKTDDTLVSPGKTLTTEQKVRLWDQYQEREKVRTDRVKQCLEQERAREADVLLQDQTRAVFLDYYDTKPVVALDWQPMETAPKGDTLSVLAWFCGQVVEVSWEAEDNRWFGHVGEEYTDSDLDAWAPKPAGPSFGRGVQQ